MAACAAIVACACAAPAAEIRVVVASAAPPLHSFQFGAQLNATVDTLRSEYDGVATVELVAPPPPDIPPHAKPGTVAAVLSEAVWNASVLDSELSRAVGGAAGPVLIALVGSGGGGDTLCDRWNKPSTWAVWLDPASSGAPKKLADRCAVYPVPSTNAAYLNGVIAGVQAATTGKRVHAISFDGDSGASPSVGSFQQGVADGGNGTVCFTCDTLRSGSRADGTADAAVWTAAYDAAWDVLANGTDVVYGMLGVYNGAVAEAVAKKASSDFDVYNVAGAGGGAVTKQQIGNQLTSAVIDWATHLRRLIDSVSSGSLDVSPVPDLSQSQWMAPWVNGTESLSGSAHLMSLSGCKDPKTKVSKEVRSLVAEVAKLGVKPSRAAPAPSDTCIPSPPINYQASAKVGNCLPRPGGTVRLIGIGMYINNLGDVDMKAGSVYVDFNLYLHQYKDKYDTLADAVDARLPDGQCQRGDFQKNEWVGYLSVAEKDLLVQKLHFLSMDRLKVITPVVNQVTNKVSYFRVQGVHYFSPSLSDWPLDTQKLKIVVEEAAQTATDNVTALWCHMPHFSGMSPRARYFPGMSIDGSSYWTYETSFSCWPWLKYPDAFVLGTCGEWPDGEPRYSGDNALPSTSDSATGGDESCTCLGGVHASARYVWSIEFIRPKVPTIMKTFLPPLFITTVNQGAWYLRPQTFETRLGVCGSSLLSAVMYHVSIAAQTPPSSVLNGADRFMLVVYVNNMLVFGGVFAQSMLWQARLVQLSLSVFKFCRVVGPISAGFAFIGLLFITEPAGVVAWAFFSSIMIAAVAHVLGGRCTEVSDKVYGKMLQLEQQLPPALLQPPTEASQVERGSPPDSGSEDGVCGCPPFAGVTRDGLTRRRQPTTSTAEELEGRDRRVSARRSVSAPGLSSIATPYVEATEPTQDDSPLAR